jgi:hypothetical protein
MITTYLIVHVFSHCACIQFLSIGLQFIEFLAELDRLGLSMHHLQLIEFLAEVDRLGLSTPKRKHIHKIGVSPSMGFPKSIHRSCDHGESRTIRKHCWRC